MSAPFVMPPQKPVVAGRVSCPKCRQTGLFIWKEKVHGIDTLMSGPCSLCNATGSTTQDMARAHIQRSRDWQQQQRALTSVAEQVPGVDDEPQL